MKILHVSSWFQPVLGYSEYHLPRAQLALGHQVAVATSDRYFRFPHYSETVGRVLGERMIGSGERVECGLQVFRLKPMFEYRHHLWLLGLAELIDSFRPDVVHLHEAFTLPVLQCALAKARSRYILVVANSMEKEVFFPKDPSRAFYYCIYSRFLAPLIRQRSDLLTAVSKGAACVLASVLGISKADVAVLPLGGDRERFRFDLVDRDRVRSGLALASNAVLIIYAGKIIEEKDVHVLVDAFARLQTKTPSHLLLLGNGEPGYLEFLTSIAKKNAKDFTHREAVPNKLLASYFSAADIGVWPSQSSNAAIEAGLTGLPLIVSKSEATEHLVAAENGFSFPRGDVPELCSHLETLVADSGLRHKMSTNARSYFNRTMSWQGLASRYLELYRSKQEKSDLSLGEGFAERR